LIPLLDISTGDSAEDDGEGDGVGVDVDVVEVLLLDTKPMDGRLESVPNA
jgi:hypothetical protein